MLLLKQYRKIFKLKPCQTVHLPQSAVLHTSMSYFIPLSFQENSGLRGTMRPSAQ